MHSDIDENERYIRSLYQHVLRREPIETELAHWIGVARSGLPQRDIFYRFINSKEYVDRVGKIQPGHPLGHYYSPVVDPNTLVGACTPRHNLAPEDIGGIELSVPRMLAWWRANLATIKTTQYPDADDGRHRYFANNDIYQLGDAIVLRAMVLESRPRKIIEIGCGFSSACMLDTIDEAGLSTTLCLIEPYPERLKDRLKDGDEARIRLIEAAVQEVPLDEFRTLGANDILFIDSTHVLKTGSDVCYELFSILPALQPGVRIHFHDVHYPFEYPNEWIFERRYSWNEVYALRAFLMHNTKYEVEFMTHMFSTLCKDEISSTYPPFGTAPGASIWLKKIA